MATKPFLHNSSGDNLSNHFLIAMPGLHDPLFANSITYICEHSPEGAMGLVVNRAMDLHMSDIFEQMSLSYDEKYGRAPILAGGPVHTQRGFILHPTGGIWQSTIQITPEISLTASKDIIAALATGQGPENALFVLGYSGWGAGQLEQEIKENSWLTVPADTDILFRTPLEQRWHAAALRLGIDMNLMSAQAGHA
ncbi:YqgE/AlgH family protein [Saccharophagus sp. K07]|jgi:putative transcriptional regulator|uniref:YqgE/AlgH family protein n=1 Tax=Saccharophagus sp. K07 TaxID=2283636 RepID=UPI0016523D46|nr:YqgE/AlgH family protein [Saccharophagus sp. K07]MBC6906033.1 YqgE/AlgH family protein [Saccharophagus sp. K07]